MTLLVLFAVVTLAVSFTCSVLEAVLLSVTPSYIGALEGDESKGRRRVGHAWRKLKEDVDRPLAAILSLNTIAHTAGAAGVGAQAQRLYGSAAVTTASVLLTLAMLYLSEIIPKTLGAVHWRGLAPMVARMLPPMTWALWPLVILAQGVTRLLTREKHAEEVSREEIDALADVGQRSGVIEEREGRMVHNLLALRGLTAADVMTPRTVAFMLPQGMTVVEAVERHGETPFSRIPVFGENRDDASGYVLKAELLLAGARDEHHTTLASLSRPVLKVPLSLTLPEVLDQLLSHREHLALVLDEFGGTAGIVTVEDVVETLLGAEIFDETDISGDLRAAAREKWRQRAMRHGIPLEGPREPANTH